MVSRETISEKELLEYISKQSTLKDMLVDMELGSIGITTNSTHVLSLVVKAIHERIGGLLGVVHSDETMFNRHWKLSHTLRKRKHTHSLKT